MSARPRFLYALSTCAFLLGLILYALSTCAFLLGLILAAPGALLLLAASQLAGMAVDRDRALDRP